MFCLVINEAGLPQITGGFTTNYWWLLVAKGYFEADALLIELYKQT